MFLQRSTPLVRWSGYALVTLLIIFVLGYFASIYFSARSLQVFKWYEAPYASNGLLEPINQVRAGDAIVLNYFIDQQPMNCWSTYANIMTGPVTHQFPISRAQIQDSAARFPLRLYYDVPRNLPPGQYTITQLVQPTCTDMTIRPYRLNTGIAITVLAPDAPPPVVVRVERPVDLVPDLTIEADQSGDFVIPAE